jgi:putative transposase
MLDGLRIYGAVFDARIRNLGLEQLRIAPRSPWQNGYVERMVGTLRRVLLDHVIALSERHVLRLVRQYALYYNADRPTLPWGTTRHCSAPSKAAPVDT